MKRCSVTLRSRCMLGRLAQAHSACLKATSIRRGMRINAGFTHPLANQIKQSAPLPSTFCLLLSIVPEALTPVRIRKKHTSFPTPAATSCLDKSPGPPIAKITSPRMPHYGNAGHRKSGWELIFGQSYRVALTSFSAKCPKSSGWSTSAWHHSDTRPIAESEAAN